MNGDSSAVFGYGFVYRFSGCEFFIVVSTYFAFQFPDGFFVMENLGLQTGIFYQFIGFVSRSFANAFSFSNSSINLCLLFFQKIQNFLTGRHDAEGAFSGGDDGSGCIGEGEHFF